MGGQHTARILALAAQQWRRSVELALVWILERMKIHHLQSAAYLSPSACPSCRNDNAFGTSTLCKIYTCY
jgi:hypothetical protein